MKVPRWLWPWGARHTEETPAVTQARDRLEAVSRDDVKVDAVMRRVDQVLRENNLAPYVMRALGVRRP